jgi:electron transport complex protein RnfA
MTFILIFISAVFVNNIVLSQFLGICPFLSVSKRIDTAIGMTGAVAFIMTVATILTYIFQKTVLVPFHLQFLQTISFIFIIASLVQLVDRILKRVSPALYQTLGVYLPLITTNCVILGVALLVVRKDFNLLQSVVFAISTSVGFGLALILFAGIRDQLSLVKLPKSIEGIPAALITAGLLAMAFMGFAGLVK